MNIESYLMVYGSSGVQNDYKMGEMSVRMICLALLCFISVANCLPFNAKSEKSIGEQDNNYKYAKQFTDDKKNLEGLEDTGFNIADVEKPNIFKTQLLSFSNTYSDRSVVLDKIKQVIGIIKNLFFTPFTETYNNMKTENRTSINFSDVIKIHDDSETDYDIEDISLNSPLYTLAESNQLTEQLTKRLTNGKSIYDIHRENHQSKANRVISGHRKKRQYRKRRALFSSFFSGGLESAFSANDDDVIFGAHTSPCDYADRHYCLSGGTCIFVGALSIKTCRCPIGYMGVRCQMINEEFLMALLEEDYF